MCSIKITITEIPPLIRLKVIKIRQEIFRHYRTNKALMIQMGRSETVTTERLNIFRQFNTRKPIKILSHDNQIYILWGEYLTVYNEDNKGDLNYS